MSKFLFIIFSILFFSTVAFGQEKYTRQDDKFTYSLGGDDQVIETNDPDYPIYSILGFNDPVAVKWTPYVTNCKICEPLVQRYNVAMQELFNISAMASSLDFLKRVRAAESKPTPNPNATEKELADALSGLMQRQEVFWRSSSRYAACS